MRRSMLAALTALLLLAWPVQAQLFPPSPGAAPAAGSSRVLIDITTRVGAGGKTEGHCMVLDTGGTIGMSVKVTGGTQNGPVLFTIYRVRGASDALAIFDQLITRTAFEQQATIEPGLFCYSLANKQPEPPGASLAELSGLTQDVALRLTLAP